MDVIVPTDRGLYCPAGDFWIDPWRDVDRAVVTHGHADHARPVAPRVIAAKDGLPVLARRLPGASLHGLAWGEALTIGAARVSLHPSGHVLGAAQVRVEVGGAVWVVSGDYKLAPDPTCAPFEPLRCDVFVTEATFGLPIFRWGPERDAIDEVRAWWAACRREGRTPVLFAYALGKAQRVLRLLEGEGPFVIHGAVASMNAAYREAGVALPEAVVASEVKRAPEGSLVVAPPGAQPTPWMRRFAPASLAFASGAMRVRGMRRRRSLDRGFVLSDHADWPGLLAAIDATGAPRVLVTHGNARALARWLREQRGLDATAIETAFSGEGGAEQEDAAPGAAIGTDA